MMKEENNIYSWILK